MRDQDEHGRHRRVVANAYALTTLRNYEPYIDELLETLFQVLDKNCKSGETIDIARWTYYFSFDVIGYLSFGSPIGFLKEGKDVHHLIKMQMFIISYLRHLLTIPWLRYLLASSPLLDIFSKRKPTTRNGFLAFIEERVQHRLQNPLPDAEARPDILAHFVAQKEKHPDIMTDKNIMNSAVLNLGAGALTTSKVLEMVFRYLVDNLPAQEHIFQEMQENGCTFPITWTETQTLPYLEAVMREAIRLHVSLGSNLMREVPASGLELPSGHRLPPKTSVGIRPFALASREDCFGKDPLTFNPDRWLQKPTETGEEHMERRRMMDRSDLTFGKGSRSCIGKNIALLETYKAVASLVGRYQFSPAESSEPKKRRQLFVKVKKREPCKKS
ncbi:uncharacterized protein BP5553_02965 [Venustampulla echinocandica]|uniref:Cytochrome P450 n=1 Tax=Venustampulla echinocandica TaxID=2656787 RepID=A0A370TSW3_9HELO|nr:uncharacterized protein BP5553_02965 [Venustampulla echinocandica]RDL38625.1 hypothetical protein BP5553_02965 [Venustampulla echinocandica]